MRLATCHAVNVNTGDPLTATAAVVLLSSATVATPAAANVVSNCAGDVAEGADEAELAVALVGEVEAS